MEKPHRAGRLREHDRTLQNFRAGEGDLPADLSSRVSRISQQIDDGAFDAAARHHEWPNGGVTRERGLS